MKSLGITLDQHLGIKKQVSSILKSGYCHLRNISFISRYLDMDTIKLLVNSLVTSRLDYAIAILYGLPAKQIKRLQRLQHCAARLVTKTKQHEYITPVLKSLDWLPIESRIKFKLLVLVYKCLNGLAPQYLIKLVNVYEPPRPLRSYFRLSLSVQMAKTATYGLRCFSKNAAELWNSLPLEIQNCDNINSFKHFLKTHFLFRNLDTSCKFEQIFLFHCIMHST